jgi:hypothetical protein
MKRTGTHAVFVVQSVFVGIEKKSSFIATEDVIEVT